MQFWRWARKLVRKICSVNIILFCCGHFFFSLGDLDSEIELCIFSYYRWDRSCFGRKRQLFDSPNNYRITGFSFLILLQGIWFDLAMRFREFIFTFFFLLVFLFYFSTRRKGEIFLAIFRIHIKFFWMIVKVSNVGVKSKKKNSENGNNFSQV